MKIERVSDEDERINPKSYNHFLYTPNELLPRLLIVSGRQFFLCAFQVNFLKLGVPNLFSE